MSVSAGASGHPGSESRRPSLHLERGLPEAGTERQAGAESCSQLGAWHVALSAWGSISKIEVLG